MKTDSMLTLPQAASMLLVSKRTMQRYVAEGRIPYTYDRGRQWFKTSDLQAFIDARDQGNT
ncbi:MAG: helix-turn-helix domain-containing protein [Terriglobia bacterium]|nr:helix-turn-helix domain-containing protein [Terriglobia bacterium]